MTDLSLHRFGRTSLEVTRIGLGLAALGRPGYINLGHSRDLTGRYSPADLEAHSHDVLDAAYAAGIRYFDAARSYGRGEEFLGSWLREKKYLNAVVGSKWGYTYTANWQVKAAQHEVKDHTLPVLQRQYKESKTHLGQHLALYHIHSATPDSGVLDRKDVLEALAELRNDGLYIGLSLSGESQAETLKKALDIQIGNMPLFSSVQATWNLLEPSLGSLLAEAHQAGMGVIVKEALANGRLTSRNSQPAFAAKRAILEAEAKQLETSQEALALALVLAQPWADVVLSGAANTDQLHDNLRALQVTPGHIDQEKLLSLAESTAEYWQNRSQLPWN